MPYYDEMRNDGAPDIRVLSTRHSIARKPHVCDWCKRPIPIGTRYMRQVSLVDGEFDVTHSHSGWGECLTDDSQE